MRHRGTCKHCGKKGKLRGVHCVDCYRAAAEWFLGKRSVLESPAVIAALPQLEKDRMAEDLALRAAELEERLRRAGA